MAFIKNGTLDPHGAPVLRQDILGNSITYVVGDALKVVSGFPVLATSGAVLIYGVLAEVETNKGVGIGTTGAAGALPGSYINSYLTTSTNQTVLMARAVTDISVRSMYSSQLTAAPGITTGSNLLGYFLDLQDETQLNEASALATTLQFFNWGVDPLNSARIVTTIHKSLPYMTLA